MCIRDSMVTFPGEKNFLAQGCAHNTHQSPSLRAWPIYIYFIQSTDLPATIIHPKCREECGQHVQVPCPQSPGFWVEAASASGASNGSPDTYPLMHCVVNQQTKTKVWGSLPGQRVQPDQNWFRNNNVFQEGFKTSAWGLTTKYQETSKEEVIHVYPTRFCMAEGFQGIPRA